jgi:hypothetical protein
VILEVEKGMKMEMSLGMRTSLVSILLLCSVGVFGQNCQSGDCQTGVIAGPFTAAQKAENTAANFPICTSQTCTTGRWGAGVDGIGAQQNVGTEYQFYDKASNFDDNIAVGPTVSGKNAQVLEWVDFHAVQAFDKVTGQPIFTIPNGTTAVPQDVTNLWSATTQPECAKNGSGNVALIYDRLDNEFVISRHVSYTVSNIQHYAWCIAASSSSDLSSASTSWYAYEFIMDPVIPCLPNSNNCTTGSAYYYAPDWPRIGTWSNGFYVTFDLTDPTATFHPIGFEACQFDRADITQGQPSNPITCNTYMVPPAQESSLIHSVDVADIDSATGPPSGEPEYFLSTVNPSDAQQGKAGQDWCTSQTTPCTSNQLALFTWGASGLTGPTFVTVNPYTPGCYDTSAQGREANTICVPEPSTKRVDIQGYGLPSCRWFSTPCVDSLGDRIANRLTYNNLSKSGGGANGEFLTASHVVMESATNGRTGIRYYILQVSNGSASVLLNSGGTSGPPDLQDPKAKLFYFMPSAALDKIGNLGFTYNSSGQRCTKCTTQPHPALNFIVLPWMATSFAPNTLIIQGKADEKNTYSWGEYASTVIDSSNGLTFYGVGEFFDKTEYGSSCGAPPNSCYTWRTHIFRERFK